MKIELKAKIIFLSLETITCLSIWLCKFAKLQE